MIHSFGPLIQDALDRLLKKGECRADLLKPTYSFSDNMGRRLMTARANGIPGITNVRLVYNNSTSLYLYINNISEDVVLTERNPQLIFGEPEGPLGIEVNLYQDLPLSILEASISRPFKDLGAMEPRLNSQIGHLPIKGFAAHSGQTLITLDDSAYRIRLSGD